MNYQDLLRTQLLGQIWNKMSEQEKLMFIKLSNERANHNEIMSAIRRQDENLDKISKKMQQQNWYTDFASDVAANLFTDSLIWVGSRLLKHV